MVNQIDKLVDKLCDLAEEEITIIEERVCRNKHRSAVRAPGEFLRNKP